MSAESELDLAFIEAGGQLKTLKQRVSSLESWSQSTSIDAVVPSNPVAGSVSLLAKGRANSDRLATVDQFGRQSSYESSFSSNWHAIWQAMFNTSTASFFGMPALTTVGTLGNITIGTGFKNRQPQVTFFTAATAGAMAEARNTSASVYGGNGVVTDGGGFLFSADFGVNDSAPVSGARHFIGLTPPNVATNVEPNTLVNALGFAQLSTDATQWYFIGSGSAAQAAQPVGTSLGAPTSTTDWWRIVIYAPGSLNATYYVQLINLRTGVVSSVFTAQGGGTTSPAATVALAFKLWRTNNTTAAIISASLGRIYFERDQ